MVWRVLQLVLEVFLLEKKLEPGAGNWSSIGAGKPLDAAVVLVLGAAVLVSRGWNDDELVVFDVGTFVGSIMELNSFLVACPCLGRFSFKSTRFCLMCGGCPVIFFTLSVGVFDELGLSWL
ncbi:unnamed protein product [Cuscuta campestris]|uniref:Uncharacterized protein n=1 Tax=Cuscuta campestris TaxID=132261 RepID=A0A484N1G7_9ASTE|nr:unnamed protein product [Cuscuta campestris]